MHCTLNRQQQLLVHTHQPDANAFRLADMVGNRSERACQLDVRSNLGLIVPPADGKKNNSNVLLHWPGIRRIAYSLHKPFQVVPVKLLSFFEFAHQGQNVHL